MRTLQKSNCLVAKNQDDFDQLFGFIVFEEDDKTNTIHYIYVKKIFRRLKIATQLLNLLNDKPLNFFTHKTYATKFFKKRDYIFNPYLFQGDTYEYQTAQSL